MVPMMGVCKLIQEKNKSILSTIFQYTASLCIIFCLVSISKNTRYTFTASNTPSALSL